VSDWADGDYYDVNFAACKSRRYHIKMRAFYEWCHNLARVATALTGTASFFVLLATKTGGIETAKYLTAVVAIAASIDSVFRFERKARLHDGLGRSFTRLCGKIAEWDETPVNLHKARAARLKIEEDEPPLRRLIDLQAQNEEARARGIGNDGMVPLSRSQRMFGYVITFGMVRLERWLSNRA
jgi:hypothetical protein